MVANFGRLQDLVASGDLDRVIQGLVEHSGTLRLPQRYRVGDLLTQSDKVWGPALIFERVWEELGLAKLLGGLVERGHLGFDFERGGLRDRAAEDPRSGQRPCRVEVDRHGVRYEALLHFACAWIRPRAADVLG